MHVDFPYHLDARGRTATTDDAGHIRDMIEQLLFTSPGERVNRPTFGCGLLRHVFAPNSRELAGVVQLTVQGALQQSLGDLISVQALEVAADGERLHVTIQYVINRTNDVRSDRFTRAV